MPQDEKRTPEQAAQLARTLMKRMLEKPPQTHDEMTKKPKKKSRKK